MSHCDHHDHSHEYFRDNVPVRLDEMHYKDLMLEIIPTPVGGRNSKLPVRDWSGLIPLVDYEGYKGNTLKFFVPNKYNGWETYIRFDEWWDQVRDPNINAVEASRLLLWGGNLRLHCNCPSFTFWGFNYILDQYDSAIYPETRFPRIRNPELKGVACKHLIRSLKVLPFHLGHMASAIKEQRKDLVMNPGAASSDERSRYQNGS